SLEGVIAQTLLPSKDGKGRVAAIEILIGVPALRNLIREDKTAQIQSVIQTGSQHGMQSLEQCLRDLIAKGKITREEAEKKVPKQLLMEAGGPQMTTGPATGRPGMAPQRP